MVEHAEVKKAIIWADRVLEKLYHEISYGGKTYGIIASHIGIPISLVLYEHPHPLGIGIGQYWTYNDKPLLGPGFSTFTLVDTTTQWLETAMWDEVAEEYVGEGIKRFKFTATGRLGFWYNYLNKYFWTDVCKLNILYQTDPDNVRRMRLDITLTEWAGDMPSGDIYFDKNIAISDAKAKLKPYTITVYTPELGAFPENIYWPEDTFRTAYYWWLARPECRSRVRDKMMPWLKEYGYKKEMKATNMLLGVENFPETDGRTLTPPFAYFPPSIFPSIYHTCDVWGTLPKAPGAMPYYSRQCWATLYVEGEWGCISVSPAGVPRVVAAQAMHLINKYRDPTVKDGLGNSAEDYIINGYKSCKGESYEGMLPSIQKQIKDYGVCGLLHTDAIPFTVMGYGYGYENCREMADYIIELLVRKMWGYPFEEGKEHIWRVYGVGEVYRPDITGYPTSGLENPDVWGGCPPLPHTWQHCLINFLGLKMPGGLVVSQPAWAEGPIALQAPALRIYEAYRWRTP